MPAKEECISAIREVNLPDRILSSRVKELSPVWKQKLLLAVALVRKAPAFLLDDPTDLRDAVAARELMQELLRFKSRDVAILLTTHDPVVARDLGDRIGILDRGLITKELDPRATSDQELFSALRSNRLLSHQPNVRRPIMPPVTQPSTIPLYDISDLVLGHLSPERSLELLEQIEKDPQASSDLEFLIDLMNFARQNPL